MKMSRRRRRNNASLTVPKTMASLVKCLGGVVFQLLQKSTDVALTVTGIEREEAVVEICSTVFAICSSLGFVECTQNHILTVKTEPAKDLLCQLFNVSPSCLPSCPTGPVMSAGIIFAETKINIPRKRTGEEAKQSLSGQPSLTLPSTRASSIELLDDEAQEAEFVQVDGNSLQEMMESSLDHHGVIFKDIAEKYASDGDIYCRFVHKTWPKREGDEVGVFPISFKYLSDALVCKPVSSAVTEASGDCKIVFPASLFFGLNLEGEFLQFCYLSGPEVKGASTPFRIFRPQEEEMREVAQEDDGDFVILKSKDALFQEQMDQLRSEKGSAISERDRAMRDLEKANKTIGEKDLEIKQKEKHLVLLNYKVEDLENELAKQRQDFQEHKDKVRTTYNDILSVKEEEYTEVAKELQKIQVEHDSAKQMIAIKEKENNDLYLQINQLKAQASDLEKSLEEEKEVSRLLKSELDAATGTVQSLSKSLEKTSMERDSEKDKMKDLEKQVSNLTLRLKVAAEEYEKKGKECVKLEGKYNRLQEKINTFMQTARRPTRSVSTSSAITSADILSTPANQTAVKELLETAVTENLMQMASHGQQVVPEEQEASTQTGEEGAVGGSFEEIVSLPCSLCGEVVLCSVKNLQQMTTHLETVHKQRVCPVCSQLFDATMEGIDDYLAMHVENHFCVTRFPENTE